MDASLNNGGCGCGGGGGGGGGFVIDMAIMDELRDDVMDDGGG